MTTIQRQRELILNPPARITEGEARAARRAAQLAQERRNGARRCPRPSVSRAARVDELTAPDGALLRFANDAVRARWASIAASGRTPRPVRYENNTEPGTTRSNPRGRPIRTVLEVR